MPTSSNRIVPSADPCQQSHGVATPPSKALAAAREYAEAGLDTYPVWPGGPLGGTPKAPACGHGYKDASRDPQQLIRWFADGSKAVAISTGLVGAGEHAGTHLVVIDLDSAKREGDADGMETLRRWEAGEIDGRGHELPPTLEATTPNGGRHLYYWSKRAYGCTANADLRIDVRCGGGGIIAPPSVVARRDGTPGRYEWVGGRFDPTRIAEANQEVEALIDLVFARRKPKPKPATISVKESAKARADGGPVVECEPYVEPDHVPCGGRHDAITRYAAHLQAKGLSDVEIFSKVQEFVRTKCEQPAGDEVGLDEVMKILAWVLSKPKGSAKPPVDDAGNDDGTSKDAPSPDAVELLKQVRSKLDEYGVYTVSDKGKQELHPDRLTEMLIFGFHTCKIGGAPAIWIDGRYLFGIGKIAYVIELACPSATSTANASALKKVLARLEVERDFALPSPALVRFRNGVLDLDAREFRESDEFSWRERIPNEIPHDYDPCAAPVPVVENWLDTLADGHEDVRRNLLQVIFMCMTRYTKHEQVAVLTGDGANGKSKFVDVLTAVVGDDNASSLSLARMGNRFEIGDMAGVLVNVSSDISSTFLSGEGAAIWKQVSGSDVLKADVKRLDGFTFRPYCQLVVVCNAFPRLEGGIDKAIARRLHVIPFTHSFRGADGRYSADADPDIVGKICQPEAMRYLLRLAVEEGVRMLDGREFMFSPNYACEEEVHKIAVDNSSFLAWAEQASLTAGDLHMQRRQVVYDRYASWCKRSALKPVASSRFADEALARFPELACMKVRAKRCTVSASGYAKEAPSVQYNAFVDAELYASERDAHVAYVEVLTAEEKMTGYSEDENYGRRTNFRVEELNLGVWPASILLNRGRDEVSKAYEKLVANLSRYED